jgi:hypothetical protein
MTEFCGHGRDKKSCAKCADDSERTMMGLRDGSEFVIDPYLGRRQAFRDEAQRAYDAGVAAGRAQLAKDFDELDARRQKAITESSGLIQMLAALQRDRDDLRCQIVNLEAKADDLEEMLDRMMGSAIDANLIYEANGLLRRLGLLDANGERIHRGGIPPALGDLGIARPPGDPRPNYTCPHGKDLDLVACESCESRP